jgi:hypothetical protein
VVIELVDPRGASAPVAEHALAPRPAHLERVGVLVNEPGRVSGPSFARYAEVLDGWLRDGLGVSETVFGFKPVLSRRADDVLLERYRECSAVVNGLAK